ncbi:hypothetical protein Mapa_002339 [Marchantia paleacea]|nr:hypothetical protein Mapa_002339 [Marchantia paleacea]
MLVRTFSNQLCSRTVEYGTVSSFASNTSKSRRSRAALADSGDRRGLDPGDGRIGTFPPMIDHRTRRFRSGNLKGTYSTTGSGAGSSSGGLSLSRSFSSVGGGLHMDCLPSPFLRNTTCAGNGGGSIFTLFFLFAAGTSTAVRPSPRWAGDGAAGSAFLSWGTFAALPTPFFSCAPVGAASVFLSSAVFLLGGPF